MRRQEELKAKHRINLRRLRQDRGLTQTKIAGDLDVGQATIHTWEVNRQPATWALPELARIFNCSVDDLFDRA